MSLPYAISSNRENLLFRGTRFSHAFEMTIKSCFPAFDAYRANTGISPGVYEPTGETRWFISERLLPLSPKFANCTRTTDFRHLDQAGEVSNLFLITINLQPESV